MKSDHRILSLHTEEGQQVVVGRYSAKRAVWLFVKPEKYGGHIHLERDEALKLRDALVERLGGDQELSFLRGQVADARYTEANLRRQLAEAAQKVADSERALEAEQRYAAEQTMIANAYREEVFRTRAKHRVRNKVLAAVGKRRGEGR